MNLLERLTKQEINIALGGKYSLNQLKSITKEKLLKKYSQDFMPKKRIKALRTMMEMFIEEEITVRVAVDNLIKSHKEKISKAFIYKDGTINIKRIIYFVNWALKSEWIKEHKIKYNKQKNAFRLIKK